MARPPCSCVLTRDTLSVLTGLTRRDVRKQRVRLASSEPTPSGYVTKASLLLSAWHHDPEYTRLKAAATAIAQALDADDHRELLVLMIDGDIGKTIGHLLDNELEFPRKIVSIDGERVGHGFYSSEHGDWSKDAAGTEAVITKADGQTVKLTLADYY